MFRGYRWLITCLVLASCSTIRAEEPDSFLPLLSNDDAWKRLPRKTPPLPNWARMLLGPLPKTTASMLELDRIHRAENPLGPVLTAKLHWIAADLLGCEAGRKTATGDLARAGLSSDEISGFIEQTDKLTEREILAYRFARKMTKAAYTISDGEFSELLRAFGPEKTMAMVHTLAYVNFLYRIQLALQLNAELESAPPFDVPLDKLALAQVKSPIRPEWSKLKEGFQPRISTRMVWQEEGESPIDIFKQLDEQKARQPRIPLPDKSRFTSLPPGPKRQSETIVWMTASMGHQPKLTQAWFTALSAFQSEASFDRVASNSVFWVVTRTNECFY